MRTHVGGFLDSGFLFVIGHDRFEKIAEALVAAGVVLACHLQQQFLERIKAAQGMTRDGITQTRPQHHELLLPLVLRRADSAAYGIVETAQLAFGAGVHVAHAADHTVRLIVEIQRIGYQFFDVDFRRPFEAATTATTPVVTAIASLAPSAFAAAIWAAPSFTISLPSTFPALSLPTAGKVEGREI